jgi:serine/threonine-protein kinase
MIPGSTDDPTEVSPGPPSGMGPAPSIRGESPPAPPVASGAVAARSMMGPPQSFRDSRISAGSLPSIGESGPKVCPMCGGRYPVEFNVCPRDATALVDAPPEEDDLVGTIVADTYKLVRLVGEGGMGRVYEARHLRLGTKRFAIKMLHPEYARHAEALSRFQREAETAASIASAHVAGVYDVHKTATGQPFIVAEFLEGRELAEFIAERGIVDVAFAVRVARQVARALVAAHEQGIVHRDMKPENVFLTGDLSVPVAKVIDFGISKIKDPGGANLTKTGMIMGTPAFMAPEQARGEAVDQRADVYAVGAILYNLLTGKRPFDKNDPTATITAVLLEEPERPSARNPAIPQGVELVIQRAMAKSAADRYPTMKDLEEALAAFDPDEAHAAPGAAASPERAAGRPVLRSTSGFSTQTLLAQKQRDVELSRPMILLFGGLGAVGIVIGMLTFVGAVIRITRGATATSNVTGAESLIIISLLTLALATPLWFAFAHVKKAIWNNTAKTVGLANELRRVVTTGFVAYGVGILGVHVIEAIASRSAVGPAWPVWDVLLTVAAATGAVVTRMRLLKPR